MKRFLFLLSAYFLLFTTKSFAQNSLGDYFLKGSKITSSTTPITLSAYLAPVVQNLPIFTGLAAFLTAIFAGIKYISAADNEKEIKAATTMLTYALIGLTLSVAAFGITQLILSVGGGKGLF